MSSLETFTDSKANEEKKKGKGKGCERPVGNHPRKKETKKEPSLERGCECACGYSKMITVARDGDPSGLRGHEVDAMFMSFVWPH